MRGILFTISVLGLCAAIQSGCDNGSTNYSPTPSSNSSSGGYEGVDYDDPAFKNADPKVQEDILIYDMLRKHGYSDAESKNAVINSQ